MECLAELGCQFVHSDLATGSDISPSSERFFGWTPTR